MIKLLPILLISIGLISGCSSTEAVKTNAYGGDTYKVKCKNTPEACLEEAYTKCNGETFTTLYSDSHAGGILADLMPGPTTWYALTFKCGGEETKPNFPWVGTTIEEALETMSVLDNVGKSIKQNNNNNNNQYNGTTSTNCYTVGNTLTCNSY